MAKLELGTPISMEPSLSRQQVGRLRRWAAAARRNFAASIQKTTPNLSVKAKEDSDEKTAGDRHDMFNVLSLPVIVVLILMNMDLVNGDWQIFWWTGEYFLLMWWTATIYFLIDVAWVLLIPICVKSPAVIVIHHFVTIAYMLIPYFVPEISWLMGACLIVEVNTWFLIMRRYGNKSAIVPWSEGVSFCTSLRLQLVVMMFYATWVGIRLILYPVLLPLIVQTYIAYSKQHGWINALAPSPFMHSVFLALNFKWSYDLLCARRKPVSTSQVERGL